MRLFVRIRWCTGRGHQPEVQWALSEALSQSLRRAIILYRFSPTIEIIEEITQWAMQWQSGEDLRYLSRSYY